VKILET
jgi:hypothetical protein